MGNETAAERRQRNAERAAGQTRRTLGPRASRSIAESVATEAGFRGSVNNTRELNRFFRDVRNRAAIGRAVSNQLGPNVDAIDFINGRIRVLGR